MNTTVANNILAQLGGLVFLRDIDLSSLTPSEDGIRIDFEGGHVVNRVYITVTEEDSYGMKFIEEYNGVERLVKQVYDVYSDNLRITFNAFAGLTPGE